MTDSMQLGDVLPVGSAGKRSGGWWGMLTLVVTEGSLFSYLVFSYFYLASQTQQQWPPEGLPDLLMPGFSTFLLFISSFFIWLSEYCLRKIRPWWSFLSLAIAFILGTCFVIIQLNQWSMNPYSLTANLYGSLFFTITGFHVLHVAAGLIILAYLLLWIALGYFDDKRHAAVTIGGLYWHFVNFIGILIFCTLYLSPYLY